MPYDDDDDQIYDEPPEGMLCLQEPVKFIENFLVIFISHWDVWEAFDLHPMWKNSEKGPVI